MPCFVGMKLSVKYQRKGNIKIRKIGKIYGYNLSEVENLTNTLW